MLGRGNDDYGTIIRERFINQADEPPEKYILVVVKLDAVPPPVLGSSVSGARKSRGDSSSDSSRARTVKHFVRISWRDRVERRGAVGFPSTSSATDLTRVLSLQVIPLTLVSSEPFARGSVLLKYATAKG